MAYEVEIRCDVRKGNPIEKKRCHSDAQARADVPRIDAATSRDAVYAVENRARGLGWKHVRRAGRPAQWVCPVCQARCRRGRITG